MPIGWEITVVVLCVAVIVLAIIVLGLLRQVTPILERAAAHTHSPPNHNTGPELGKELPHFAATGADGLVTDAQLRGRPAILLFLSQGCGPCEALAREMRGADLGMLASELVIVTDPDGSQSLGIPADLRILTERDGQASEPLSVNGTPFAIAVDPDGIVRAARVPNTVAHLKDLAATLA